MPEINISISLHFQTLVFPKQQSPNEAAALGFPEAEGAESGHGMRDHQHPAAAGLSLCLLLITSKPKKHDPVNALWE